MNNDDFRYWLDYHGGAFPAVARWMLENASVKPHWERTLEAVDLDTAKRVTDGMADGTISSPKGFGEHARHVKRFANEMAYAEHTRRLPEEFECEHCDGSGLVTVWHPKAMSAMRRRIFDPKKHGYTCGVACSCSFGSRFADPPRQFKPIPRFSEDRMVRIEAGAPGKNDVQRLEDFCCDVTKHANYHDEFAAWSGQGVGNADS